MIYDVRYETGDFIHCFFKFLQLLILDMNSDKKKPSDMKPGSQRLQKDLTLMDFQMMTDLRMIYQANLNVKAATSHSVE